MTEEDAVVHLHSGTLLVHKKEEILPFPKELMSLESIMLSEIRQVDIDKYHRILLIYEFNEQNK